MPSETNQQTRPKVAWAILTVSSAALLLILWFHFGAKDRVNAHTSPGEISKNNPSSRITATPSQTGALAHGETQNIRGGRTRAGISVERVRVLYRALGHYISPPLGLNPQRADYTDSDILNMYPFLYSKDGSVDKDSLSRIKAMLQSMLNLTRERTALSSSPTVQPDMQALGRINLAFDSTFQELMDLTRALEYPDFKNPKAVSASEELTRFSPSFATYSRSDLQSFLSSLALLQTQAEETGDMDKAVQRLKSTPTIVYKAIHLSEDQAKQLLETPLERMVNIFY